MAGAKNDLAHLLAAHGEDLDRALRLAEEAQRSIGLDASSADTVGFVYLKQGQPEAALEQFRQALELNEEQPSRLEPTLHYHLGLTLDALDRDEEAANAFEKALAIDADFPDAADARQRLEAAGRSVRDAQRSS